MSNIENLARNSQQILGAWRVVRAEIGGEPSELLGTVEVFEERTYWWTIPGDIESELFGYRIDATSSPKQIDIISDDGTLYGIYEVRGDELIQCFPDSDGDSRPTSFVSCASRCWNLSICKKLASIPHRKDE